MNSENLSSIESNHQELPHSEIAERARTIWQEYGNPTDRDLEIWLEAEHQLANRVEQHLSPIASIGSSPSFLWDSKKLRMGNPSLSSESRLPDSIASEDAPGSGQSGLSNPGSSASRGR